MKNWLILAVIAVVVVSGCVGSQQETGKFEPNKIPNKQPDSGDDHEHDQPTEDHAHEKSRSTGAELGGIVAAPASQTHNIEITSSGFSPETLSIYSGDTVTWTNKGTSSSWPASARHPTHTIYPGSDIQKCGTSEEINIFDACKDIMQGETYSFKFNEVGTWAYHDHKKFSLTGKIIVQ